MNARSFRPLSVSVLLALLAASARAAEVSAADAARAASAWVDRGYAMGRLAAGRAVAGVDEVADPATGAQLRVVRFEGGGYVVLSADDLVDPVIAFSETGDGLVLDERNPLWALLRGDIAAREAAAGVERGGAGKGGARRAASTEPTAAQGKWAALLSDGGPSRKSMQGVSAVSDVRVAPFIQSKWSQSTHNNMTSGQPCYNYYTPDGYVCGCTATAIAQIMRYWRYPTGSVAANTYPCSAGGVSGDYTMKGGTYDWDAMPLVPASGVTEAQRQAIGKLTYDVGVTVEMEWNEGGSSSSLLAGVACLPIDFGYANAKAVHYGSGQSYSLAHLMQGIVPNLDARCPVGVSVTGAGGHSVVGDGYGYSGGDFYIHLNMGWSGSDDAWYCPPNLGTTHYAFNAINGYLFNVFPRKTGSIASGRVLDASGAPVAGATVALKRNGATVETATSDANGIYAFIAAAGTYVVAASKDGSENSLSVTLADTTGSSIITTSGERGWYYSGTAPIGNTYGNDISLTGMAATPAPVFSPGGCLFYPTTSVTITCSDASATIRYTTDGSAPTESSPAYTGPILVEDDVTIKARAFSPGKNPSPIVAETYTYDAAQGAPKGDYFADPIKISGMNGTRVIEDNSEYTVEDGEPTHTLSGGSYYTQTRTVWYQWKAPGTGTMTFKTSCRSSSTRYQTFVAVYTGDTLKSITRLAFATAPDSSSSNYATPLALTVSQGTTYRIVGMVGSKSPVGSFTLEWSGDLTVAKTPYETWAADNGIGDDPEAKTDGVENLFRYAFGRPTGPLFPIASVSFDGSGNSVLELPTNVVAADVTLTVLSSTNLVDWTPRATTVGADGTIPLGDDGTSRFYRLKAVLEE